jgi:hypothetical protein
LRERRRRSPLPDLIVSAEIASEGWRHEVGADEPPAVEGRLRGAELGHHLLVRHAGPLRRIRVAVRHRLKVTRIARCGC